MLIKYFALGLICLVSLASCGPVKSFGELSAWSDSKTQAQYLYRLPNPDWIIIDPETGVQTWGWACRVRHERYTGKQYGAKYWYEGYYLDCTYEVSFDQQGNKIGDQWIGTGCFDSKGNLYRY